MRKRTTRVAKVLVRPFETFFEMEASGGILLIIATIVALAWANSPFHHSYEELWELPLTIGIGDGALTKSLHFWINDGLMAIFFFLVGLEIKREVMAGELSSLKEASLPILAAIGGMVVPATIFVIFNAGKPSVDGWGIPMATDIAFSLGVLKLLGKRVPLSLKIFLTAFAIVDDIGAVLVIALFYTASISYEALSIAGALFILIIIINYFKVRNISWYIIIGIVIWYFFLKSGIHPTVAGVLVAFAIPVKRRINLEDYLARLKRGMEEFITSSPEKASVVLNANQISAVSTIENASEKIQSPLQKLEERLHGFVIYFIMPVFALANAGVVLAGEGAGDMFGILSVSIAVSLLVGKVLGILIFVWLGVRFRIITFPVTFTWTRIIGLGLLGGIGFTMSLFIANLAFLDPALLAEAKMGILMGSLIAGVTGYFVLRNSLTPLAENLKE